MKRSIDMFLAATAICFSLPMFAVVFAILYFSSEGPVFYRHRRVGRNGREFYCLKFRTMVVDSDAALTAYLSANPSVRETWEQTRKLKDDPRVTAFGRVLRKSSVDELPQLLNILKGDMSFVGPRPIVGQEVPLYGSHIDDYYRVRPGLTGLWQVARSDAFSFSERVTMDTTYVRNQSLLFDLYIIARTIPVVFTARGCY